MIIFIFFSARGRAEFNKSCNLIGSRGEQNFLIRTATAGGIHHVHLFSMQVYLHSPLNGKEYCSSDLVNIGSQTAVY